MDDEHAFGVFSFADGKMNLVMSMAVQMELMPLHPFSFWVPTWYVPAHGVHF